MRVGGCGVDTHCGMAIDARMRRRADVSDMRRMPVCGPKMRNMNIMPAEVQAILKGFYKESYGLDMPTFVYDPKQPFQGRGVYRPGM